MDVKGTAFIARKVMLIDEIGEERYLEFLSEFAKKEPLITAMITGNKPAEAYEDAPEAVIVRHSLLRALVCLVIATALVFGTIFALGGKML